MNKMDILKQTHRIVLQAKQRVSPGKPWHNIMGDLGYYAKNWHGELDEQISEACLDFLEEDPVPGISITEWVDDKVQPSFGHPDWIEPDEYTVEITWPDWVFDRQKLICIWVFTWWVTQYEMTATVLVKEKSIEIHSSPQYGT